MPDRPGPTITRAIADLRVRCAMPLDIARRGPVLLDRCYQASNLTHQELRGLSTAIVVEYMLRERYISSPEVVADLETSEERLDGFLFWADRFGLAFVNADSRSPLGRRRFTAAHELGHALLHRDRMGRFRKDVSIDEVGDDHDGMEKEANQFAAELLMPAEVCHARADELRKSIGASDRCPRGVLVYRLAAELLVSREAMRYRLAELEVGDE